MLGRAGRPQPSALALHWQGCSGVSDSCVTCLSPQHLVSYAKPKWQELIEIGVFHIASSPDKLEKSLK